MAAIDSDTRISLENELADIVGITFDDFNNLNIYYRLRLLEEVKDYNKLHRAIEIYAELQNYQLISWGMPKFTPSLADLDKELNRIWLKGE